MKDFRSLIKDAVNNRDRRRKQLSAVISLSVLISFAVPMVLTEPASSMTLADVPADIISTQLMNVSANAVGNVDGEAGNLYDGKYLSPVEISEVELLMGNRDWVVGCNDANSVSMVARKKFFLGVASDFCVFLESDFNPQACDAEGRVAVGGNVEFGTKDGQYNYMIGEGDYGNAVALGSTSDYKGITGFAHLITNGTIKKIATFGEKGTIEQRAKRLFVNGFDDTCVHWGVNEDGEGWGSDKKYRNYCVHSNIDGYNDKHVDELKQIYKYDDSSKQLINFDTEFDYMRKQSQALAKIKGTPATEENGTVIFDAGDGCNAETVYFELDSKYLNGEYKFEFKNIPKVGGTVKSEVDLSKHEDYKDVIGNTTEYPAIANIVINVKGDNIDIRRNENTLETKIDDFLVSNIGGGQGWTNNHPYSSNILYNFVDYNNDDEVGKDFNINTNFNGTILAPNADVKANRGTKGHLSGALIAKSYEGDMEFGYRPYRGPANIVSSASGYGVPINKIAPNGDKIEGAVFEVLKGKEDLHMNFISDENGEVYVNIPSAVDFTGKTNYDSTNSIINSTYIIKEKSAPEGFIKDDTKEYRVNVEEVVDINSLRDINGTVIPTKVTTKMTAKGATIGITLEDIYSYDAGRKSYIRIRRELIMDDGEIFYIDFDSSGKASSLQRVVSAGTTATQTVCATGTTYTVTEIVSSVSYVTETEHIVVTETATTAVTESTTTTSATADENGVTASTETTVTEETTTTVSYVTVTDDKNNPVYKDVPKTTVTEVTKEKYKNSFDLQALAWNVNKNATIPAISNMTLYYSNGSSETRYSDFSIEWKSDYWGQIAFNPAYENVVGVNFEFANTNNITQDLKICFIDKKWATHSTVEFKSSDISNNKYSCGGVPDADEMNSDGTFNINETKTVNVMETTIVYGTTNIVTFDVGSSAIPVYPAINTETTPIEVGNKKYKYDPETAMVIPLKSGFTESFTNQYGLIFEKVDDDGEPVPKAEIAIQEYKFIYGGSSWTNVKENILEYGSSKTIDLDGIDEVNGYNGPVYRFVETYTPEGYETADYIYFVKDGNNIYYQQKSKEESFTIPYTAWDCVDLTKNNTISRQSIKMEDKKVRGAEIKLSKWNKDFTEELIGAKFELYDSENNLVVSEFEITENPFSLYDYIKNHSECVKSNKVQNCYLTAGSYYLKETDAPVGYEIYNGTFDFKVKSDNSIVPVGASMSDPEDMYLGKAGDNNPTLTITGKLLETAKANPDEYFVENLWSVSQIHVSTDNSNWGGNLNIANKDKYTFNEILTAANKNSDEIKYVRFMQWTNKSKTYSGATSQYYDGSPASSGGSGGSSSSGNYPDGVTKSKAGNNPCVEFSGAALESAKNEPNKVFFIYDLSGKEDWADGQVHLKTTSSNNFDDNQIKDFKMNNLDTDNEYTLQQIIDASGKSKDEITSVRFLYWGADFSNMKFPLSVTETPTESENPETSDESTVLAVNVVGDTIQIPNKPKDTTATTGDITVEKEWADDDKFADLRPASITVTLKRKKLVGDSYVDDTDFDNDAEITKTATIQADTDGKWKYTFTNLEKGDTANPYKYYVVEDAVTNYTPTISGAVKAGEDITITNTLKTIGIEVNKKWLNKDGGEIIDKGTLPDNDIVVQVEYRASSDAEWKLLNKTVTLSKADNWTATVDKLPEAYEYKFEEVTVISGYECTNKNGIVADKAKPTFTIINQAVGELPSAGGKGTTNYYFFGALLISMSGMVLLIRRRKTAK